MNTVYMNNILFYLSSSTDSAAIPPSLKLDLTNYYCNKLIISDDLFC